MLSHLFIAALWSPAGKGLTSSLLFVMFICVFVTLLCGILGQMLYLIVSIYDLCLLTLVPLDLSVWASIRGGTSSVDLLCFFQSCVCYAFVHVCLYVHCSHLLGKG